MVKVSVRQSFEAFLKNVCCLLCNDWLLRKNDRFCKQHCSCQLFHWIVSHFRIIITPIIKLYISASCWIKLTFLLRLVQAEIKTSEESVGEHGKSDINVLLRSPIFLHSFQLSKYWFCMIKLQNQFHIFSHY